jgi:hypothetical protein
MEVLGDPLDLLYDAMEDMLSLRGSSWWAAVEGTRSDEGTDATVEDEAFDSSVFTSLLCSPVGLWSAWA